MTSVRALKRDIEMLERVLTPKTAHKDSDDLNQLLKKHEQFMSGLTADQEHEMVKEVVKDLQARGLIH